MATIKFVLSPFKNKKGKSLILLQYGHQSKRLVLSSHLSINGAMYWDEGKGRVRSSCPEAIYMNEILQKQESKVNRLALQMKLDGIEPTIERIRQVTRQTFIPKPTVIKELEAFIGSIAATKAVSTIAIYKNVLNTLKQYEKNKKEEVTWENIDCELLERLASFLFERGISTGTVKRNTSYLKSYLSYCCRKNLLKSRDFENYTIKVPKKAVISLTEEELEKLKTVTLAEGSLSRVNRIFLFCCMTGIRFSDITGISKHQVETTKSGRVLKLTTKKTKQYTVIPLIDEAFEILEKMDYDLFTVSHQRYLKVIKKVAKRAGINSKVSVITYKGSVREESVVPKYEVISSHTARRTFISLSLQKGVPIQLIASITHNGNISSLMRYVAIDEDRKNEAFFKAWSSNTNK